MKTVFLHIIIFLFASNGILAQEKNNLGYRIENDEVVFLFDIRDYKKATKNNTSKQVRLDDLEIYKVCVAGEFNNWSRDAWKMFKTGEYSYELRKKLKDLDHSFSWEFKFVINGNYWAEPDERIDNVTWAHKGDIWLSVYNLKMYTAHPSEDGNAKFFLEGHEHAREVILTGSFNKWDEQAFKMYKTKNGWSLNLVLGAGQYEYKFIVDGRWYHDEKNPNKKLNEFLNYNSIIRVKKPVNFLLKGFETAETVTLVGDFNSWDKHKDTMIKTDSGWYKTIILDGGKCHYKFYIDDQWINDPQNPVKEYDSNGFINSVKMVE